MIDHLANANLIHKISINNVKLVHKYGSPSHNEC
jgi:hypothetical protein